MWGQLMGTMSLSKETSRALRELTGEPREDLALVLLMRDYARHKLAEIDQAIQRFEQKYGTSFADYQAVWEGEEREEHYTFEAETDFLTWEALITQRQRLQDNFAWLP